MTDCREELRRIASRADETIDVARVALLIAKEEYPDLDVDAYLARIDGLGTKAREAVPGRLAPPEKIAHLNQFLFVDQGFEGNEEDYYDPRNSFLNDVLDRRQGIPISLALVYTEVAQRLGLDVRGVGFPGHFLVKHVGPPEILIDPYFGGVISRDECRDRLRSLAGDGDEEGDEEAPPDFLLESDPLRPATSREIVTRMLRNLKQVYVGRDDHERALACVERILLFVPGEADEIRDRGILYLKLECFGSALRDLESYLATNPREPNAQAIRDALPEIRREVARIH